MASAPGASTLVAKERTLTQIIRAKVGLLELAKQLANVSQACKMMGYSRDSFYRFKELYDKGGELEAVSLSQPTGHHRAAHRGCQDWPQAPPQAAQRGLDGREHGATLVDKI